MIGARSSFFPKFLERLVMVFLSFLKVVAGRGVDAMVLCAAVDFVLIVKDTVKRWHCERRCVKRASTIVRTRLALRRGA